MLGIAVVCIGSLTEASPPYDARQGLGLYQSAPLFTGINKAATLFVHATIVKTKLNLTMDEYFEKVADAVTRHTGYPLPLLLHDRRTLPTDARYLLVYLLGLQLADHEIVVLTGLPKQTVSRIRNEYGYRRRKFSLMQLEKAVKEEISDE